MMKPVRSTLCGSDNLQTPSG